MRKASIGKAILLALALVLYGPSVLGQTRAAIYPIGNVSVTIPIPEGYIDVNDLVGDKRRVDALRTLLAATFASPSRPLGIFVSRDEISTFLSGSELKLVHVFSVSTNQNLEPQTLSTQEFQMAADIIRRQGKESVDTMEINRLATQVQLNAALESIRQKTRVLGVGIGVEQPIPMGVFQDDARSIGIAHLISSTTTIGSQKKQALDVKATVGALVKGKLIVFGVASSFHSKDDLDWVKAKAIEWYMQMIAVN